VAIATEARDQGRKRKMSPTAQPSSATNMETENVVKLLMEEKMATIRSALGRRRSKRKVLVHPPEDLRYQPFAGLPREERKILSDAKLCSSFSLASSSLFHSSACGALCLDQALQFQTDHLA
jgi:hypothetical protein